MATCQNFKFFGEDGFIQPFRKRKIDIEGLDTVLSVGRQGLKLAKACWQTRTVIGIKAGAAKLRQGALHPAETPL